MDTVRCFCNTACMRIVAAQNLWTVFAPGRVFSPDDTARIVALVAASPELSRRAIAGKLCASFGWLRADGSPKLRECWEMLRRLEQAGAISLPALRGGSRRGLTQIARTTAGEPRPELSCALSELRPLSFELVRSQRGPLWRELIDRYHYLGFATALGAQLRYLVRSRDGELLACLQFSSAAWRMGPRDRWIGWSNPTRVINLPEVVQQSRFLILPWVRVSHLASHILARSQRVLVRDWQSHYRRRPRLLETLVDPRFAATSYRAANWIELGITAGGRRTDRLTERRNYGIKRIFVMPLGSRARQELCRS
jgi:hypothetical protein